MYADVERAAARRPGAVANARFPAYALLRVSGARFLDFQTTPLLPADTSVIVDSPRAITGIVVVMRPEGSCLQTEGSLGGN